MSRYFRKAIALENEIPAGAFVFLGGTTNETTWREELIDMLTIDYFNPVVEDWTKECIVNEENAKLRARALLYVINPKQMGNYSIAEMTYSACMEKDKHILYMFQLTDEGEEYNESQIKSNYAIIELLSK